MRFITMFSKSISGEDNAPPRSADRRLGNSINPTITSFIGTSARIQSSTFAQVLSPPLVRSHGIVLPRPKTDSFVFVHRTMNYVPFGFVDSVADVLTRPELQKLTELTTYFGRIARKLLANRIATVHAEFYVSKGNAFGRNVSLSYTKSASANEVSWLDWTPKCRSALGVDMCTFAVHEASLPEGEADGSVDVFQIARSARRVFLCFEEISNWKLVKSVVSTLQRQGIQLHEFKLVKCDDADSASAEFIRSLLDSPCAPRDITVCEEKLGGSVLSSKHIIDFFATKRTLIVNLNFPKGRPQNVLKAWKASAMPFSGKFLVVEAFSGLHILDEFVHTGTNVTYTSSHSLQFSCDKLLAMNHPTDSERKAFAFALPLRKDSCVSLETATKCAPNKESSHTIIFFFT